MWAGMGVGMSVGVGVGVEGCKGVCVFPASNKSKNIVRGGLFKQYQGVQGLFSRLRNIFLLASAGRI